MSKVDIAKTFAASFKQAAATVPLMTQSQK